MDDTYLVEIRLATTKWRIKQTVFSIARSFGLRDFMERHPHVTLYGPLTLNEGVSEQDLLDSIREAGSRFGPVPFTISAWEKKQGLHGSVIAFSVLPSGDLRLLTRTIADRLLQISTIQNAWDSVPERKWFHVTVANRLENGRATDIFSHLTSPVRCRFPEKRPSGIIQRLLTSLKKFRFREKPRPYFPEFIDEAGLRITVMNGEEILAEYEFARKAWIDRDDLSSPRSWQDTLREFRRQAGFERSDISTDEPGDIFVMADLHCGHANIIRYCCRPFSFTDVGEMDSVLINNWNLTVPLENEVFFLGDLCYGKDAKTPEYYLDRLNGKITLIRGNHDDLVPGTLDSAVLDYGPLHFLLVHDPGDAPPDFEGWVIHGHHHNNNLREYPFICFAGRRVNVSAEVVGYSPVSLREIAGRINEGLQNGTGSPVHLRYPYIR
jgi:calcineurin-like phosphoesterase family protein